VGRRLVPEVRLGADVHGLPGPVDLTGSPYSRGIASPYPGRPPKGIPMTRLDQPPKPGTATAAFLDGDLTVRLTFPAQDAAQWRSANAAAILAHLGLADPEPFEPAPCERHRTESSD
jgi:hypothetical protein